MQFKMGNTGPVAGIGCGGLVAIMGLILVSPVGEWLIKGIGWILIYWACSPPPASTSGYADPARAVTCRWTGTQTKRAGAIFAGLFIFSVTDSDMPT